MKCLAGFMMLIIPSALLAQKKTFSVGTRATVSMFNDDDAIGSGLGGQFRYQFADKLNSEWYLDYITSHSDDTYRNDYHIGWSLMFYPKNNYGFNKLLQPYLVAGHCFDYSKVTAKDNPSNYADRLSMALQAGTGTHINITHQFDCSLTAQYMLHLGKEIEASRDKEGIRIEKKPFSHLDGHLLFALSINYKLGEPGF